MTSHDAGKYAGETLPNVRAVLGWTLFTWVSTLVGVVLCSAAGNWVAVLYSLNAAVLAAGWFLACQRWTEWRALAEVYGRELVQLAADNRRRDAD